MVALLVGQAAVHRAMAGAAARTPAVDQVEAADHVEAQEPVSWAAETRPA